MLEKSTNQSNNHKRGADHYQMLSKRMWMYIERITYLHQICFVPEIVEHMQDNKCNKSHKWNYK